MADASRESNRVTGLLAASNADGSTLVRLWADPSTHELLVSANVSIAANSSVNVNQWGGTGTTLGQKAMTASVPVTLASDQSALAVTLTSTTVTGSVAVTNAGLTELAAAINASSQMDVNIAANGIGLATSAKQDTMITSLGNIDTDLTTVIGHVDGIEALLATIDADTGNMDTSLNNIETAIQLIDDIIYTAGTDTYTEATSKGGLILAVRRDADKTLANTTNEFVPLQVDANGYLKVEVFSGATLPVSLTSTTYIEVAAIDKTVFMKWGTSDASSPACAILSLSFSALRCFSRLRRAKSNSSNDLALISRSLISASLASISLNSCSESSCSVMLYGL